MALTLDTVLLSLPELAGGGVMLALAALLVRLDPRSLVHWTFALLMVSRGMFEVLALPQATPEFGDYSARVRGYFSLATFFTLLAFAAAFESEQGKRPDARRLVAPLLLLGLAAVVWYALDHGAYRVWGPAGAVLAAGPLFPLGPGRYLAQAVLALHLLRNARRQTPTPSGGGLQVVALALLAEPLYLAAGDAVATLQGGIFATTDPAAPGAFWRSLVPWISALSLSTCLLAVGGLALEARRGPDRRFGLAGLGVALGSVALVVLPSPVGFDSGFAIASLALPVGVSYALARYRFLDLDLRLKASVRTATVAGILVLAYVTAGLAAQAVLPPREGQLVAFGAPALLLLAIHPLQRLGGHVAEAVFPQVEGTERYLRARRREVYEAALEHSLDGRGEVRPAEVSRLAALRQRLGLGEDEHAEALAAARANAARHTLAPGGLFLGRYRVVRPLGRGASGEVWLARDERERRDVAIKHLAGDHRRDAEALRRLHREADVAARLQHPNLVRVHGVEEAGEDAYLIMEHAAGGSLADRLRQGPLPETEALALSREVLAGLGALHARKLVHRDVKPSNILLAADGRALLGDFSLAREVVSGETVGAWGRDRGAGTLAYMAPEQARGMAATPRSDLYAVGTSLYEMLTGAPPVQFEGLSEYEARNFVARSRPALPLPDVSAATNAALARALAKDPRRRYRSADDMAAALAAPRAAAARPGPAGGGTRPR